MNAFYPERASIPVVQLRDPSLRPPVHIANLVLNDFLSSTKYQGAHKSFCAFEVAGAFWGSSRTGYHVAPAELLLADVMAVSGGAISAAMGKYNDSRLRGLVHFFGLELGRFFSWKSEDWDLRIGGKGFLKHVPSVLAELSLLCLIWLVRLTNRDTERDDALGEDATMALTAGYGLLLIFVGILSQVSTLRGCFGWMQYSYTALTLLQECSHDYVPDDGAAPAKLFLTDGGHYDNLGILALLERECKIIICADSGYDPMRRLECIREALKVARLKMGASFAARSHDGELIDADGALEEFSQTRVRIRPAQGP